MRASEGGQKAVVSLQEVTIMTWSSLFYSPTSVCLSVRLFNALTMRAGSQPGIVRQSVAEVLREMDWG